jgi:hypothetical protein
VKIQARRLLDYHTNDLWSILDGEFALEFDDGEIINTNAQECIYSSHVWDAFRKYPAVPLNKDQHVASLLNGARLNSGTHLALIGRAVWYIYDNVSQGMSEEEKLKLRSEMAKLSYDITNRMYNDLSYRLEAHVMSLDILDFHQIYTHPEMVKMRENLKPSYDSIANAYKTVTHVLRNVPELHDNPLSKFSRSSLASENQMHQCLGPRGYITDTDSLQFDIPVLTGYAEGVMSFYDSAIESRSAAKSLIFSKAPLQDTEYFSRRLQLVAMGLENLHHTDCGTGKYTRWTIAGKKIRDGKTVYEGDLKLLAGKNYVDANGNLKQISQNDTHLIGETLQLRTVLHCAHPDPMGVCSTCFGGLSDSIPPNTNLGHACSTFLAQKSSQSVLSVKHLDSSATIETILLSDGDKMYLKASADGNSYQLADKLKGFKISLVIGADEASNITDIRDAADIGQLVITRVSELETIGIVIDNGKVISEGAVDVTVERRKASMTREMLQHIRENGWHVDSRGNYLINMNGWDWNKPILTLPLKHYNMQDHSSEISKLLEGSVKEILVRDQFVNPDSMLGELFLLVNSKLSVNLAPLEVTFYTAMIASAESCDYSLPKPWTTAGVGVMKKTMTHRSLSAAMAFENHVRVITNPDSFALANRVEHVFDAILMPREINAHGIRRR